MDKIELFRQYLSDRPGDRFASYGLALELKKAGRIAEAEAAFRALLLEHPESGAGHYQLGLLLKEAGRPEEALVAWRRGLEVLRGVRDAEARRSVTEIEAAVAELEDEL